jgi:hypothetical protein
MPQFATQAESNSVSNVPPQLEQRPGRAGARWTVSDRPHITQYRRTVVRTARRSAALFRGCFLRQRQLAMHTVPTIRIRCVLHGHHEIGSQTPESFWLEQRDSDGAGPRQHDVRVTKCRGTSQR